jgi:hypothetical protein
VLTEEPQPMTSPSAPEDMPQPQQAIVAPPELPATPRPFSAHVAGLALREPRVRFWFILTSALSVIMLYVLVTQLVEWSKDRQLVLYGTPTDATIVAADLDGSHGGKTDLVNGRRPWNSLLHLRYTVGGKDYDVEGYLSERPIGADGKPKDLVEVKSTTPIRISPTDPERWTDRKTTPPFANAITSLFVLFPIVVATGAGAFAQRRRVLETWRLGELVPAAVLSSSTTPIAPSYAHISAIPTSAKATSVSVYVPRGLSNFRRGDVIWLLTRKNGPALAAKAFL